MSYGVYYRELGSKSNFIRVGQWVKSSRAKIGERFVCTKFLTELEALEYAENLASRGYEVKIKTLKG